MGLSAHNPARGSIMLKAQHSGSLMNPNPVRGEKTFLFLFLFFDQNFSLFYLFYFDLCFDIKINYFFHKIVYFISASNDSASPALDRRGLKLKRRGTGTFVCKKNCKNSTIFYFYF